MNCLTVEGEVQPLVEEGGVIDCREMSYIIHNMLAMFFGFFLIFLAINLGRN
jgi:hypothetical protein